MYWFKMLLCWLSVSFLGGLANICDQSPVVCCLSALFVWGWYLMLFSVYQPGPECVGPVWVLVLSLLTRSYRHNTITYTYFNPKYCRVQIMSLDDWWSTGSDSDECLRPRAVNINGERESNCLLHWTMEALLLAIWIGKFKFIEVLNC